VKAIAVVNFAMWLWHSPLSVENARTRSHPGGPTAAVSGGKGASRGKPFRLVRTRMRSSPLSSCHRYIFIQLPNCSNV
jgi:hypothetical protein